MDKAKQAVSSFLSKDGHHDTTVRETVNPAVVNEHITKTKHEEAQKIIDREVHQDHYHTSVQPIQDKEVLPEQHVHNQVGVETREFSHGNDDHIRQRVEAEKNQFRSTREVGETRTTASAAPTVAGEHVHHHVHETIQPVVQKEVIQPAVVHTTIPVHEVHHNEAKLHSVSQLPAMTMSEFERSGGHLSGREERTDQFAGAPRPIDETLGGSGNHSLGGRGAAGSTTVTERDGSYNDRDTRGTHHTTGTGIGSGSHHTSTTTGTGIGSGVHDSHDHREKKPSLLDKLNPLKDTDHDGKKGVME